MRTGELFPWLNAKPPGNSASPALAAPPPITMSPPPVAAVTPAVVVGTAAPFAVFTDVLEFKLTKPPAAID